MLIGVSQLSSVDEFCILPAWREYGLCQHRRSPASTAALPPTHASQCRFTAAAERRRSRYPSRDDDDYDDDDGKIFNICRPSADMMWPSAMTLSLNVTFDLLN